MKLPPIIHLFEVTADRSGLRGGRRTYGIPYHFKKDMVCQFKNGMVCPPATSEAEATSRRSAVTLNKCMIGGNFRL
jgi:hypothetical protein